jgi:predicted anti-sigma-YlaC factor YlaD
MNCEQYQLNVSKLIDNELNEADSAGLFTHMGSCAACREFFRTLVRVQSMMDTLHVPEPIGLVNSFQTPGHPIAKTAPIMHLYRKVRETRIPVSVAAAAVIVAMAGTVALSSLFVHPAPPPGEGTERIVYSYLLPTVYVQPPQKP